MGPLPGTALDPAPDRAADPAPDPALEIERLSVRYGSVLAVDEISYACAPGRITALLGPNGAGKSSVLNAVSTAVPIHSGHVRIFGHDVRRDAVAARARLGLVFQDRTLDQDLSVYRNLWFHARLFGMGAADARERIDELLRAFDLAERRDSDVRELSGGLARRVELARALLHRPGLLILDEPTTGLDPEARARVWADLRRMRTESGVTILFSTHYMDEAEFADEILIVHGGELVRQGSADALRIGLAASSVLLSTQDDTLALANLTAAGWDVVADAAGLAIRCEEPEEAVPEIVRQAGTGVGKVSVRHPTLDEVYLSATTAGRTS